MAITTVTISNLSTWLSNQPVNTKDTPYELNITGLTTSNLSTLKSSLKDNSTKYVDLSGTTIPNSVTNMDSTFSGCSSLVNVPVIPNSVTRLSSTFDGCTSLVNAPVIPNSVTDMESTFNNCTSLEKISVFNVDPSKVNSKVGCFTNTPSTLKVYVPTSKLSAWQGVTASDWGLSSTSVFKDIATRVKSWIRIA